MARPINADAKATRARILDAAVEMFSKQGLDGASVRGIARHAEVSPAMVHHHFGSKEGLYEACIDVLYEGLLELQTSLSTQLDPNAAPREVASRLVRSFYRFARKRQAILRLQMRGVVDRGELDPSRRESHQLPLLSSGARLLGSMVDRPEHELRLALQSLTHLIIRYALSTHEELARLANLSHPELDPGERIEEHLIHCACALLCIEGDRP